MRTRCAASSTPYSALADALRKRAESVRAASGTAIEEHEALDKHIGEMQAMAVRIAEKRRAARATYESRGRRCSIRSSTATVMRPLRNDDDD